MKNIFRNYTGSALLICLLIGCLGSPQGAFAQSSTTKTKAIGHARTAALKTISVNVCPISGAKVIGAGGGTSRVGNYQVHFCCSACKPVFDKMTKAQQLQKIKVALAKS